MSVLTKHANVAIRMYNNGIDINFIKNFSIHDILKCCNRIENNRIINEQDQSILIQEELIKDDKFIEYLKIVYENELDIEKFEYLIKKVKEHDEKITDYTIKDIVNVLTNQDLNYASCYDYLKYFSNESIFFRKTITNNLNYFHGQDVTKINELTKSERELFKLEYLDNCNLIPRNEIKEIYAILANNQELKDIMDFFHTKKLYVPLYIQDYEKLNINTREKGKLLKTIANKIQDDEIIYQMLLKWVKNDCSIYDLKVINKNLDNIEHDKMKNIFNNRTGYINFIYGSQLKNFPIDNIYGCKEEIIIYAIRNDKKGFLKLIEENIESFLSIPSNSILYNENFYKKYINLNELTLNHLTKLKTMNEMYSYWHQLKEQLFTFEEINALYNMQKQYIDFYNELLDLKVDDRLIRIRQLSKKDLLHNITNNVEIKKFAEKLKVKPLYSWIENDFNKIQDLKVDDAIQILINYEEIGKFLPEIKNQKEISYILRNIETVVGYDNLKSIKDDIENLDQYWIKLKNDMRFSEDFLQKYSNNVKDFLLDNGAELAYTYYKERNTEQKEAFKLIVKAQIMGEFNKLKYYADDLIKEIDYELKDYQKKVWTEENVRFNNGKYNIGEYDDFYYTMILGEYPKRTCLSYKNGGYNECLLACFDSNKKILYAKIKDKIVGRAMVRLTKGAYDKKNSRLSFIDVETGIEQSEESNERLTLFLERPYISGISESEEKKVKELFVELLKTKAKQMDALLVLSSYYNDAVDKQFILARYYMYISKSKSSCQYLDSLSGEATITDEGQYKKNTFLIWKPIENRESIFEESIFS